MIHLLTHGAHRLDAWLRVRLGRPYGAALTAGLVLSIIGTLRGLAAAIHSSEGLIAIALTVLFQLALLINQLGQFHEFHEARRLRKAAREATPPSGPAGTPPPGERRAGRRR